MLLLRQTWILTVKNLTVVLVRNPVTTLFQAFFIPLILSVLFTVLRRLYTVPSHYGVGVVGTPVRDLASAFAAASGNRDTLVLASSGFQDGDIARVIEDVAKSARDAGLTVQIVTESSEVSPTCRSYVRGLTRCFGAAVFYGSPSESDSRRWNYTMRGDLVLGNTIYTDRTDNDAEIYILPLQHAIDSAIARGNGTEGSNASVLPTPEESMYTSESAAELNEQQRLSYMGTIISALGAAFFTAMVGVTYHLGGFMAFEREIGMSQLIDATMPHTARWQPQFARLASHHIAFTVMYLPGWILIGVLLGIGVFSKTSMGIVIIYHILNGMALTSFAIFAAAFFQNVQLSGNSISIVSLLLAVLASFLGKSSVGAIAVLSLLLPPMNYVFFLILMARWERADHPTNLVEAVPDDLWNLAGIVLWVFLIIQIFVFPVLGAIIENALYGQSSSGRRISSPSELDHGSAVTIKNLSKTYHLSWLKKVFGSTRKSVQAVDDVSLSVKRGQIMVLLGANGSGKTTLLNSIVGLGKFTSGQIYIDGLGGMGYTPQKNVLWNELTVEEHVGIFSRLKSAGATVSQEDILALVQSCDLTQKLKIQSKALSGGQKRKLQLALMLSGDSQVCCIDEVSSGLDPLSRRMVWDILLAQRGSRTIIMTTHFLDEAGLLADHIAILSKGRLCVAGSAVELTDAYGEGYEILVPSSSGSALPTIDGVSKLESPHQTIYSACDSATAAFAMQALSRHGITDYDLKGPTMEDVFTKVVHDKQQLETSTSIVETLNVQNQEKAESSTAFGSGERSRMSEVFLFPGGQVGVAQQAVILFQKRLTLLRRNFLPHLFAFIIPVVAAGVITLLLKSYDVPGCTLAEMSRPSIVQQFSNQGTLGFVVGPPSKFQGDEVSTLQRLIGGNDSSLPTVHVVETRAEFDDYIKNNYANVTPGGFFLDDTPVFAFRGDGGIQNAIFVQNLVNALLSNQSIDVQYASFDSLVATNTTDALQIALYLTLAMMLFPAFFALYPTAERVSGVRALHYSNGIRALPLWLAYLAIDFAISIVICSIIVGIVAGTNSDLYNVGYLFLIFVLYSLASITFSYVVSKIASSQLMAFAIVIVYQGVMLLAYFMAWISILSYVSPEKVDSTLLVAHYAISIFSPITSIIRALFLVLNLFSASCLNDNFATNPGAMNLFGGPILYLVFQTVWLFLVLVLSDGSRAKGRASFSWKGVKPEETVPTIETQSSDKASAAISSSDPIQVLAVNKNFGKTTALDALTFSVRPSEVFALVGPNGAGKSTAVSLIRGEIAPDHRNGGDIVVANHNLSFERAAARDVMGVCPQFDALDTMTVKEHLEFYARVRGVKEVNYNVDKIIKALELEEFTDTNASDLSGGNKRKLSLGITLVGNPQILILDEPSSGMDPLSKRAIWRTLQQAVVGRSLLLTTHSMEEAAALAGRVCIIAQRMLAVGEVDGLRREEGLRYYVHCVLKNTPSAGDRELQNLKTWVEEHVPGAEVEPRTFHGQMKFSVPGAAADEQSYSIAERGESLKTAGSPGRQNPVATLFQLLEDHKDELGLQSYSVQATTLDEVFLKIVSKNNVQEEGAGEEHSKKTWWEIFKGY